MTYLQVQYCNVPVRVGARMIFITQILVSR